MADWPVIMLPVSVPATVGQVDLARFTQVFDSLAEPTAQRHWVFGDDNADMLDLTAGVELAPRLGVVLNAGGSGFASSFTGSASGTGQAVPLTYAATVTAGTVTALDIVNPGSADATAAGTVNLNSAGGGSGATATMSLAANPTQSTGFLSLANASAGTVNGWMSDIDIDIDQTLWMVAKRKSAANSTLYLGHWSPVHDPGAMVLLTASDYTAFSRSALGNFGGDGQAVTPPAGSVGDWLFLAMSHTAGQRTVLWGGGSPFTQSGALSLNNATNTRVGFGSSNTSYLGGLDVAEFGVIDSALDGAALDTLYDRRKAKLLTRGITVL